MPEERIIPAIESVAEFKIKIGGEEIPRTVEVLSVHVSKIVNRISFAKIVLQDGDPASGEFENSSGDLFIPGNEIEITAGDPDNQTAVFTGIITKQSVSIRSNRSSHLIIECKHKAIKTTITRRSNCWHDETDDSVIQKALKASGLSSGDLDIESSTVTHPEMVQYNCTDWDFAVSRAEVAGKIVLTNDDKIVVKAPDFSAATSVSLLFGATIIELDAEMNSQLQYKAVKSKTWDMGAQALTEQDATEPTLPDFGNLDGSTVADANEQEEFILQHGGALATDEIKMWADAQLLKSRLAKIRGRVKFEGIAAINPGDMLELNGLGDRFTGTAFVSGVRQDYNLSEGWKTQAQLGHTNDWFYKEPDVVAAKAGGLLPGTIGLHTGIVTDNDDKKGEYRVKVKIPFINETDDGVWARIAQADAGDGRGLFFRPETNDEVLIGFLYDDPRQPVVLGMLNSSALPASLTPSNDNDKKGYTSREKMLMIFDDKKKEIVFETPGGNKITISDDQKGIVLQDMNKNMIEMNDKGIKITSKSAIEISASTDLKLGAANLKAETKSSLELTASSGVKLDGGSMLEIKGGTVKINC
jgi:Rhs element Vgr protein